MTATRIPSQDGVPRLLADVVGSRPAANTVPTGAWFYATDEDTIYRSDGTNWSDGIAVDNPTAVAINTEAESYTLVADDAGKVVRMNAGTAVNLTVPAEASVNYDVGTVVGVRQAGAGTVTVVEDTGVTVNIESGLTLDLRGQYAEVSLHKVGADTWEAVGGFAEST